MNVHMRRAHTAFAAMFDPTAKQETDLGICAEDEVFVAEEDLPMKCEGNPFDDIPLPFDPYRQLSTDEE